MCTFSYCLFFLIDDMEHIFYLVHQNTQFNSHSPSKKTFWATSQQFCRPWRVLSCAITVTRSLSHLELVLFDDATWLQVLPDLVEDSQHGDVGFSGASRCTDEKILISVVGRLKNNGLNSVQSLHAFEDQLPNLRSKESKKKKCDLDYIYSIYTYIQIPLYK